MAGEAFSLAFPFSSCPFFFASLPAAHTVRVLPVKVRPQELVMCLRSYTRRLLEATPGGESSKVNVLAGVGQAIHRAVA